MEATQPKSQDIPFVIDGIVTIVKSVTKHTTCNDVINKLPNLQCPLAVYESVDGIERELSGKTKLLKIWRAHGASSKVAFVVKKSEESVLKRRRSTLFSVTRKVLKPQSKRRNSKENLKKVTDLAFYVRYQKSKVQSIKRKFEDADSEEGKGLKHFKSTSSMDSMDRFLVKTDLEKMDKFLAFCSGVTDEQLGLRKAPRLSREHEELDMAEPEVVVNEKETKKSVVRSSLKNMKLGFKQKFAPTKNNKRTTSAGTLSSADTGYSSTASTDQNKDTVTKPAGFPKRHTFILPDVDDAPRHSTPVGVRTVSCTQPDNDTSFALSDFDENEGKDALLQKFMADQDVMARRATMDNEDFLSVSKQPAQRTRSDRYSLPAFITQKDRCRFYWDMYCDSDDSDTSSVSDESDLWDASQLDNAFIDSKVDIPTTDIVTPKNRTLRRESAISNLARFSLVTKPINIEDDDDSFDYSFNCTFPRMDDFQSGELTCFGNEATYNGLNTMLGDGEFDGDVTKELNDAMVDADFDVTSELLKDICDSEDSFEDSDEGLGSMSSGSYQNIMYI